MPLLPGWFGSLRYVRTFRSFVRSLNALYSMVAVVVFGPTILPRSSRAYVSYMMPHSISLSLSHYPRNAAAAAATAVAGIVGNIIKRWLPLLLGALRASVFVLRPLRFDIISFRHRAKHAIQCRAVVYQWCTVSVWRAPDCHCHSINGRAHRIVGFPSTPDI